MFTFCEIHLNFANITIEIPYAPIMYWTWGKHTWRSAMDIENDFWKILKKSEFNELSYQP